jgi:hypothetical protein
MSTTASEQQRCKFCGCMVPDPCDHPPPDTCERALDAHYARRQPFGSDYGAAE